MAVYNYKKYKISLSHDSNKTQGLKTGDIVRRQYFNGKDLIYSLMCVLDYGIDIVKDEEGNNVERPYFIGALLEGNAPQQNELLDFARITNLFDESRSGALYLTASDDQSPFMDVIDGIGRNCSLCWPEAAGNSEYINSKSQYVLSDNSLAEINYIASQLDSSRICRISKNSVSGTAGIKQDFYEYVENPNRVLISYKVKTSRAMSCIASLEYVDGVKIDGTCEVQSTKEWSYQFHAITVDWSGRHLRTVKISFPEMAEGDIAWISDFNVILLSSLSSFKDSSKLRTGQLAGIVDPVYGRLSGYGNYIQKLYSSGSAHISGTLTAGDENGFAATFYAGKIHRNAFLNSLSPTFIENISIYGEAASPTGVGNVYVANQKNTMIAQTRDWLLEHIDKEYCFSFWCYAKSPCDIILLQNNHTIGRIEVSTKDTHAWRRHSVSFKTFTPDNLDYVLQETMQSIDNIVEIDSYLDDDNILTVADKTFLIEELNIIENSMEKVKRIAADLNKDGLGEVYTYNKDIVVYNTNSIYYTSLGLISLEAAYQDIVRYLELSGTFLPGEHAGFSKETLLSLVRAYYEQEVIVCNRLAEYASTQPDAMDNPMMITMYTSFSSAVSDQISEDEDIVRRDSLIEYDEVILLSSPQLESGLVATQYQPTDDVIYDTDDYGAWFNRGGIGGTIQNPLLQLNYDGEGAIGTRTKSFLLRPNGSGYLANKNIEWRENGDIEFSERVTLKWNNLDSEIQDKISSGGYALSISSSKGTTFQKGHYSTVLKAVVYYAGVEVEGDFIQDNFTFRWYKYQLPNTDTEVENWWIADGIDHTQQIIEVSGDIGDGFVYRCELISNDENIPQPVPVN